MATWTENGRITPSPVTYNSTGDFIVRTIVLKWPDSVVIKYGIPVITIPATSFKLRWGM